MSVASNIAIFWHKSFKYTSLSINPLQTQPLHCHGHGLLLAILRFKAPHNDPKDDVAAMPKGIFCRRTTLMSPVEYQLCCSPFYLQ